MAVKLVRGQSWQGLLDHLADELLVTHTDPFAWSRVVVSSAATGRVVSQEVAHRLGISSGINYLTPAQFLAEQAARAGVTNERSRWLGTALDLATWEALEELADTHRVLARATDPARAGGRRATATRLAKLQRWYLDVAPDLLADWLGGSELGPDGSPLPERWAWQPALLRACVRALGINPLTTIVATADAAAADATPTIVFAVDDLTVPQRRTLEAIGELTVLAPVGSWGDEWATALADSVVALPQGVPTAAPRITVHDSHGPARQVEVLRDELTRAFEADPTLEPRQVAIICPKPAQYATLLDAAFQGIIEGGHPGRQLRVQAVDAQPGNPTLLTLATLIRLGELRASASQIVELLLSDPVAHRWGLNDRQALVELVSGAGIRWGMDAAHREGFQLGSLAQNTWMRGLDRLLVGLAVADGHDAGMQLAGAEAVQASDLDTIGALAEIVSRMRRLITETATPTSIPQWVHRARGALNDLLGVSRDDEWQLLHVHAVLARLQADHEGSETQLTRSEFAHLLAGAARETRARVAAGNGSLMVAPLGELRHVGLRLVALLGITDDQVPGSAATMPDAIDLGELAPDQRQRRLTQLLDHARSAEQVLIVRQAYSQRTGDAIAPPAATAWLLEQLDVASTPVRHPPTSASEANFAATPSFDQAAHSGALARRRSRTPGSARSRRRAQACHRAIGPLPQQVSVAQLARFLADPAKAFLRTAAGVALYAEPSLTDQLPLELGGLEQWKVVNALLDSLKQGTPLNSVIATLVHNEELPPGLIGRTEFALAKAKAELLWREASPSWQEPTTDHPIDLVFELPSLGTVRLVDQIRCRAGVAVAVTASRGSEKLIEPYLESLALAASGLSAVSSRVFRLIRDPSDWAAQIVDTREFAPSDQAEAHRQLATSLRAYLLGSHRLIPAPASAAIRYAQEVTSDRFAAHEWRGTPNWRHPKWSSMDEVWGLFYEPEVADLFTDAPTADDPVNGQSSAFGTWALALYGAMTMAPRP